LVIYAAEVSEEGSDERKFELQPGMFVPLNVRFRTLNYILQMAP